MKSFEYYLEKSGEVGFTRSSTSSVAYVDGLPGIKPNELVVFETGQLGQAFFLEKELIEVLLFSEIAIKVGTRAVRTGEKLMVPVGEELLGQVIDPLGRAIDAPKTARIPKTKYPVESQPWGISKRAKISQPLETGVAVVDTLVPLGRGQRELVVGDRKTGKTGFILQTLLFQKNQKIICIYVAIGKRKSELKRIKELFTRFKTMEKTVIIGATSRRGVGLLYLAPFSGMALAEYFRDQGKDVLLVLDDLTTHAKFYREISLLAKRFPGRDSYPVDIFFTHARIMERGGNFKTPKGEVSITILPVAETISGDLTGYIQTNLMSMTDGHIFFDREFFIEGRRPAVNPFLSVTRVGHQTQTPLKREISRELLAFLSLYNKMKSYVHFGAELTEEVKQILTRGERIQQFFVQTETAFLPPNLVFYILALIWLGKEVDLKKLKDQRKIDQLVEKTVTFAELLKKTEKFKTKDEKK